jgi:NAD+ synthase (glutamine-hydrolysing)
MDYADLGFIRVAAVAPEVVLGQPAANAAHIVGHIEALSSEGVALALFPELSLTGYSCEDLFFASDLHVEVATALLRVAEACRELTAVVGLPWRVPDGRLLNCAAVLHNGRVHGLVPKVVHPNYGEFYDDRWFSPGGDVSDGDPLVDHRQLFGIGGATFAIEICEDLWSPEPPGIRHCLAGADLVLNLSASNELVAKADYRRELVRMASARGICGYLYAGAGPTESTKDVVYGGHLMAAENGQILAESDRFCLDPVTLVADLDLARLRHDRLQNTTVRNSRRPTGYNRVKVTETVVAIDTLQRAIDPHPFVPEDEALFDARAQEILDIQATGLARRVMASGSERLVIGLSGGLDSTLAFLVCLDAIDKLGRPAARIEALTMPGPGTSEHTLGSARALAAAVQVEIREIPIGAAVTQHLKDLRHDDRGDIVFENTQARERTQILFDYANKVGAIVVGTGDLSELALGWCTYNADHMSSYNVNASVPKTMVAYLVRWYGRHRASGQLARVLTRVLDTPISPELLAPDRDGISQETESIIGPYELHDFFLYHFVRTGAGVEKIFALACLAFREAYSAEDIQKWLRVFFTRFFTQQFKRTVLPPGPKVGTVSLSPRGDWRMPDEAGFQSYLATIDTLLDN